MSSPASPVMVNIVQDSEKALAREFATSHNFNRPMKIGSEIEGALCPKKIVLIAHSGSKAMTIGNKSPEYLAELYKTWFQNQGWSPSLLNDIYLVSCEAGLSYPEGQESLAQRFARAMETQGFGSVKIHAISNPVDRSIAGMRVSIIEHGGAESRITQQGTGHVGAFLYGNRRSADLDEGYESQLRTEQNPGQKANIMRRWEDAKKHMRDYDRFDFASAFDFMPYMDLGCNTFTPEGAKTQQSAAFALAITELLEKRRLLYLRLEATKRGEEIPTYTDKHAWYWLNLFTTQEKTAKAITEINSDIDALSKDSMASRDKIITTLNEKTVGNARRPRKATEMGPGHGLFGLGLGSNYYQMIAAPLIQNLKEKIPGDPASTPESDSIEDRDIAAKTELIQQGKTIISHILGSDAVTTAERSLRDKFNKKWMDILDNPSVTKAALEAHCRTLQELSDKLADSSEDIEKLTSIVANLRKRANTCSAVFFRSQSKLQEKADAIENALHALSIEDRVHVLSTQSGEEPYNPRIQNLWNAINMQRHPTFDAKFKSEDSKTSTAEEIERFNKAKGSTRHNKF